MHFHLLLIYREKPIILHFLKGNSNFIMHGDDRFVLVHGSLASYHAAVILFD